MKLADCRIGIVGLGLMGGSLAEALQGSCRRVVGADQDAAARAAARETTAVDEVFDEVAPLLASVDLAVLAVPVRASVDLIRALGTDLAAPPRLLDLGSTKVQVVRAMEELPESVAALGGHPMCGKEVAGFTARDSALFRGSQFVLTPLARTNQDLLRLAEHLVAAIGASPLTMSAAEHDRLVAATSHLPYLAAVALVARAGGLEQEDSRTVDLMASGFRDSIRLAGSDPGMMLDILLTNRANLSSELRRFREELERLEEALGAGEQELAGRLRAVAEQRSHWMESMSKRRVAAE